MTKVLDQQMTWTSATPTDGGWYFYRDSRSVDKPMTAWVYHNRAVTYVYIFSPHTQLPSVDRGQPKDFPGEWHGPVEAAMTVDI